MSESMTTRDVIIRAAWTCYRAKGPHRTTVTDISSAAGVSRGTVYQHFKDKDDIRRATVERATRDFFAALISYIDDGPSLQDQLCRAAVFLCRSRRQVRRWDQLYDRDELALLLSARAEPLLRECVERLLPYFERARDRGEVREDLDVRLAAEWSARMLFSLYGTPSPFVDLDDTDQVRRFVRDHLVVGFVADPSLPPSNPRRDPPALGDIVSILDDVGGPAQEMVPLAANNPVPIGRTEPARRR